MPYGLLPKGALSDDNTYKNDEIIYPDSDGKPMAENTIHFKWITTIQGGLDSMFRNQADVFVAGDLLWYPVEGQPKICIAPDVMVVFGRPKEHRGSYKQWLEDDIAPKVVFEIFSPNNTDAEMLNKLDFCLKYGVQEFYLYNPNENKLVIWERDLATNQWNNILFAQNHKSRLLGIRFDVYADTIKIRTPKNKQFLTFVEKDIALEKAEKIAKDAIKEKELTFEILEEEKTEKEKALESQQLALKIAEEQKAEKEKALEAQQLALKIAEEQKAEKEKALEAQQLALKIAEEEKIEKEKALEEIKMLKELLKNKFS
ncbi:MAG: Uma2 family endonuclease [Bacteroidetes bacterium]|nr:MAG: Uma2 family endonuclease [Bacteroidota bacterium]TAG88154.1 MAG: Uma2 family endonuclease [Bacteroidota bacterium]